MGRIHDWTERPARPHLFRPEGIPERDMYLERNVRPLAPRLVHNVLAFLALLAHCGHIRRYQSQFHGQCWRIEPSNYFSTSHVVRCSQRKLQARRDPLN